VISTVAPASRATNRGTFLTVAVLFAVVVLAWWRTTADAERMCCMLDGIARAGHDMPFDIGPFPFLGMWTVMMAAMMLPGMIPVVMRWHPLTGFAAATGYLVAWALTAPIAFGALATLNEVSHLNAWLNRIGGAVIAFAGAYQFTGWKRRNLERYGILDQTPSAAVSFVVGLSQGIRCLGSAWALMSVMLAVGVMNLPWIWAIGAICLGEQTLRRRTALRIMVGLVLLALGLATVIHAQMLNMLADSG